MSGLGMSAQSAAARSASGGTSTSGAPHQKDAANSFKRLLTGSGAGQMNLGAVRARAEDLKQSLEQVSVALELYADRVQWAETLDKFGVINMQIHRLSEELRPLLKFYAVQPKAVNAANARTLPIMLATKALPEMEAEERELLRRQASAAQGTPLGAQYEKLGHDIEHLNSLGDFLCQHSTSRPDTGMLDPRGPRRKAMAQELHAAAAVPPPKPKVAARDVRTGGKRKLEGAELLMAAVSRGEGL
ncbi:g4303 [Coccomyxa elongata]